MIIVPSLGSLDFLGLLLFHLALGSVFELSFTQFDDDKGSSTAMFVIESCKSVIDVDGDMKPSNEI